MRQNSTERKFRFVLFFDAKIYIDFCAKILGNIYYICYYVRVNGGNADTRAILFYREEK